MIYIFGIKKSDLIFQESQLRFFSEELIPYLKLNNITTIMVLGDIYDTRENINVNTQTKVLELFRRNIKRF